MKQENAENRRSCNYFTNLERNTVIENLNNPTSREAMERRFDLELDTEPTLRMLGHMGLVNALEDDESITVEHPTDSQWQHE